jgi:hypothetical protein
MTKGRENDDEDQDHQSAGNHQASVAGIHDKKSIGGESDVPDRTMDASDSPD